MAKEKIDYDKLIKEEAKRYKQIVEYTFVGMSEAEDPDPEAEEPADDIDAAVDDVEGELGMDDAGDEAPADDGFGGEEDMPADDGFGGEEEAPAEEMPPAEDEVELDVTELVNSTEQAKASSDMANAKLEDLVTGFNALQQQLASMEKIHSNIENLGNKVTELEHDIERRNPTPEEQIEMRSLDSYPYSIKLTDYWSDHEDKLATPNAQIDGKEKEYTLTKQEVDDYSPTEIKKSFREFDEDEVSL